MFKYFIPAVKGKPVHNIKVDKKHKEVFENYTTYGSLIVFESKIHHKELEGKPGVRIEKMEKK